MSWVRAALFNIACFAWTAVIGTLGLPFLLAPRRAAMRFGRFWSRGVLFLLRVIVGLDYRLVGLDRIPPGGAIVAMKHQSAWDAIALPLVFDDPAPIVKRELLMLPFYGWYMARAGAIAIDRKAGAAALRAMLSAARQAAAAARPIVIFPQGTRIAPGVTAPYQPGVYALYQVLSVPLIPAAINSGLFWGRRSFTKRPGRITLEFLEPIPPGWPRRRLMQELEQRIERATTALEEAARNPRAAIAAIPVVKRRPGGAAETTPPRR
jgi:1-acyl-sn-glycerol-3-phosphate acyltransferase